MIGLYGQRSITIDVSEPLLTPAESTKDQIVVGSLVGFDDFVMKEMSSSGSNSKALSVDDIGSE